MKIHRIALEDVNVEWERKGEDIACHWNSHGVMEIIRACVATAPVRLSAFALEKGSRAILTRHGWEHGTTTDGCNQERTASLGVSSQSAECKCEDDGKAQRFKAEDRDEHCDTYIAVSEERRGSGHQGSLQA